MTPWAPYKIVKFNPKIVQFYPFLLRVAPSILDKGGRGKPNTARKHPRDFCTSAKGMVFLNANRYKKIQIVFWYSLIRLCGCSLPPEIDFRHRVVIAGCSDGLGVTRLRAPTNLQFTITSADAESDICIFLYTGKQNNWLSRRQRHYTGRTFVENLL